MSDGPVPDAAQPGGWSDDDWDAILLAIKLKQCTPFLGAGASVDVLPLGGAVAEDWGTRFKYPFPDRDLVRVAQYLAIEKGAFFPKHTLIAEFQGVGPPDFKDPSQAHRAMADLKLPVYVTTNYDDFMTLALQAQARPPTRLVCQWHHARDRGLTIDKPTASPDVPIVFHMHGHIEDPASLVLTEDDYLDFLVAVSEVEDLIPPRVRKALAESSLLFLGYSLEDINLKVLFRKIFTYTQRNEGARHFAVQIAPKGKKPDAEELARATQQQAYLKKKYDLQQVKVFWGTAREFVTALKKAQGLRG